MTWWHFRLMTALPAVVVPGLAWQAQPPRIPLNFDVYDVESVGVSKPARDLPPPLRRPPGRAIKKLFRLTLGGSTATVKDSATQITATSPSQSSTSTNLEGIGANGYAPPDENLAVGPTHIVQTVNLELGVFNKPSATMLSGFPKALDALYAGTGGACELQSKSDPIVRYDRQADRWIISYLTFQASFLIDNSHVCLAVSQTGDPTGAYFLYDVDFGNRLQDYIKFGVWPSGWFMTANSFLMGLALEGSNMCAWQRDKLLVGDATAKVICVVTGSSAHAGLLPADADGVTAPPAGSPNYFLGLYSTSQMVMFTMTPNYVNPSASVVTGPSYIPITLFNLPCGGGDCIPQRDTTQLLASVGDRLMYRLAYRNFGTHESLVVNHSVGTGNTVGVRWYEIRTPASPTIYQHGTYAPDSDYRWMASAAMDKEGNLAIGYSKSSAAMYPGIFYTGREAGDALGTLRAEQMILAGSGSQLPGDPGSNRWGDYSSIEADPVDDCTFWYTSQYLPSNGTFNWRTRIASFKFDNCVPFNSKTNTITTITAHTPNPSFTGQAYSVSVNVAPASGSTIPAGSVTVSDGAGANCVAVLSAGNGSCSLVAVTAVNRTLTAVYPGDATFNGSTSTPVVHTLTKANTTTLITGDSPDPSSVGQSYTVSFTVSGQYGGTPSGNVVVGEGSNACTATVAVGSCNISSTSEGLKTITATYTGDANFMASSDSEPHSVTSTGLSVPAAPTNLTVTKVFGTQGKKTVLVRIDVAWSDNANNEGNFLLERWKWTGGGRNRTCAIEGTFTLAANTTIYADSGATTTTCRYRIAAQNIAGTSAYASVNVPE